MNKHQLILLLACLGLFLILFFGCEKKPKNIRDAEKSISQTIETTGIQNLLNEAMPKLSPNDKAYIEALNTEMSKEGISDSLRNMGNQTLSSKWYELGFPAISGFYAEQLAEKKKDEMSWSISGTTYTICTQNAQDQKTKDFCTKRAIKSFENAISLNPDNVDHRINLAICYVENPAKDNPMQGIMMLRDLNTKYPENIAVLNQLGRLAIKTNQIERALSRLEKAISIDPNNKTTQCLLADAYAASNNAEKEGPYRKKCEKK